MERFVCMIATAALAVSGAVIGPVLGHAETPRIEVDGAWTPTLPPVVRSAELYMVIRNGGPAADRLLSARSSACGSVQVYATTGSGMSAKPRANSKSDMGSHSGMGAMGMRPVSGPLEVAARGQVDLEPGGLHLMCMNRTAAFDAGAAVPVTLSFERAGEVDVTVMVRGGGTGR